MKKSEKPTPYIYIRAFTQSDVDSCDFAIIKISWSWLGLLKERQELLEQFLDRLDFYNNAYWDSPYGYFVQDPDSEPVLTDKSFDWCYIEMTPQDLGALKHPEFKLVENHLVVTSDGFAHFRAIERDTRANFWTAEFSILDLLNTHFAHLNTGKEEDHA